MKKWVPAAAVLVALACAVLWQLRPRLVHRFPPAAPDAGLVEALRTIPRPTLFAAVSNRLAGSTITLRSSATPSDHLGTSSPSTALAARVGAGSPSTALVSSAGASLPSTALAAVGAEIDADWLRRERARFVPPSVNPRDEVPPNLRIRLATRVAAPFVDGPSPADPAAIPSPRGTLPFVLQLGGAAPRDWRGRVETAGGILRGYLPNRAWLVELDPAARTAVAALPFVAAVEPYQPSDKVQPFVAHLAATREPAARVPLAIQTFEPADAERLAEQIRREGGTVDTVAAGRRWGTVRAAVPLRLVAGLSRLGGVQWIEDDPRPRFFNDLAAAGPHLNATNAWARWGLTGSGQIVGHADTGLDIGSTNGIHPDFNGRVLAAFARARSNDWSDADGHGTHTAGSLVGDGAMSGGRYRGMAHGASLVHQSVGRADGGLTGLGTNVNELLLQAYEAGARVHSDSWGTDSGGEYTTRSREADEFAWDHPDHLTVFAAGNAGADGDTNGVIDTGTVGSPATAKNVLAVGATENDRPPGSGGYTSYEYGTGSWLPDYSVNPIRDDWVSWSATTNPYAQGMAAFSSRGPAADGRIKPDVVAPGTDILSCRSRVASNSAGWGVAPESTNYVFNGGTSMATPLAAGAAVLMRQYAVERAGVTNPSAALLKAMLVGGARSLAPGQYGTNATREIPFASPNAVEGWGQIDVGGAVYPDGRLVRLFDRIAPAEDETNTLAVTVAEAGRTLDVALSWIDFPAAAGAGATLVDDFDVEVVDPTGAVWFANGGSGPDRTNTVETIRLPAAAAGAYEIRIIGASVPETGAVAAVYVRGAIEGPPQVHHVPADFRPGGAGDFSIEAAIQSLGPLTNGEARLYWSTNDPPDPWSVTNFEWFGGADYRAMIPDQPPGTTVRYYLQADPAPYDVRSPTNASDTFHSFQVRHAVSLVVTGLPFEAGMVSPGYGVHVGPSGTVVRATATPAYSVSNGVRMACLGWTGTGSVPATGDTFQVEFDWESDSVLTWLWREEVGLAQSSEPQGAIDMTTWHARGAVAATETTWALAWAGSDPYAFAQWSVDGARWPDATSPAPNPATNIVMNGPRTAVALYMKFWEDANTNILSDWFEQRYWGGLQNDLVATNDLDGDDWTNLGEMLDNTDPLDGSSYPTPPVIANFVPLASPQTTRPPWRIEATVTDNFAIEVCHAIWREAGDAVWKTNSMLWLGNDRYAHDLDPPARGSKAVEYFLSVGDLIGYYLTEHRTTSEVYSVVGQYDAPYFDVAPTNFGTIEMSDAVVTTNLTIHNYGAQSLVWTALLSATSTRIPLEGGPGAWAHGGTNDDWHLSTNRVYRGTNAWYCGDDATRQYDDACHAWLDTPPFTVGADGMLTFHHWIKTEYDSGDHFWDGGVLRVSTNGGASYELVTPVGGYPYRITDNDDSPFPADHPCLAGFGDSNGWEAVSIDLRALAGLEVIVRFEFGSDFYTIDEGWFIGDVALQSSTGTVWLALDGMTGGTFTQNQSTVINVIADPALVEMDAEEQAFITFTHNDPEGVTSVPAKARRGRFVSAVTSGPGRVSFNRAFLFRDAATSLVVTADAHAHISGITSNGALVPGLYGPGHTNATVSFQRPETDVVVVASFDWSGPLITPDPAATNGLAVTGVVSSASASLTVPLALSHVGDMTMHFSVTSDVFWLSATPSAGSVVSGDTANVTIRADPRGREPRPYHGTLLIDAPDSRNGPLRIPVTMVLSSLSPPAGLHAWGSNDWGQTLVPSNAVDATRVAAGAWHSLAVLSNGTLIAWGRGDEGQTTIPPGLANVVATAGGQAHSVALKSDGSVAAWGRGSEGQTNTPAGLSNVVAIAAGGHSSMALRSNGTIAVWGQATGSVPASVTSAVEVVAGGRHAVALLRDGSVVAWGENDKGQTNVPGGLRALSLSAGSDHTAAVKDDGTVAAWGRGDEGQTLVPGGLSNVVFTSAGETYTAALKDDGSVVAWGVGDGISVPSGVTGVVALAGGAAHELALFPARRLVVESAHGEPVPARGLTLHLRDAPVELSVPSPLEAGGTQNVATGWTRIGSDPGSGIGTSVVFALGTDTTQTWVWATNYWLSAISSTEGGSVAPTGGWFAVDSTATVTAAAADYHHWTGWTGNTAGTETNGLMLSVPIDQPRSVAALFAPNLAAFGVPEAWLAQFGWTHDFDAAALGDTDGDTAPAWEEWAADTVPTNGVSVLRVWNIAIAEGNVTLEWSGGTSRTQFVERTESLVAPDWIPVYTNLPPTPSTNSLVLPVTTGSVFRLRIPLP
ncbi:MAG: S8 family serine peptidase [Verrucomicrobia bacterium]|nr:S8 family serine peptidase [Verrucomicrobiota bacterium]